MLVNSADDLNNGGQQRAAAGNVVYPLDEPFLDALDAMPETGGAALGVDRLLLWLLDPPLLIRL